MSQSFAGIVPEPGAPSMWRVRRLFLAALGLVYAIAFLSLWVQLEGLIGRGGILPAQEFLDALGPRLGASRWWRVPTLAWVTGADDLMLHFYCALGVTSGVALMAGCVPLVAATAAWLSYLSLYTLGRDFLSFQWDILLLEAGFLALVGAPLRCASWSSEAWRRQPAGSWVFLLRLLIFKLMFLSGVVKLSSGDPSWRDLSALAFHYETTCLPVWVGWYAYQLPLWVHRASVAATFLVELVVPFLTFGPHRARGSAALAFAALMVVVATTGNYGFFNLLAVVLCLPILDDRHLDRLWRRPPCLAAPSVRREIGYGQVALVVLMLALSIPPFARALRLPLDLPAPLASVSDALGPFHLVNGYGLFARMTTTRPELIIEGSDDGDDWQAYELRWKPGRLDRRPDFVQPHMPRLDWQMWFAALGSPQTQRWFLSFCHRLLSGSPAVRALLAGDPFPDKPPRYLRVTVYEYRFTRGDVATGDWWQRERLRRYTPVLTLDEAGGGLRTAPEVE